MRKRKCFTSITYFVSVLLITSGMISCGKKDEIKVEDKSTSKKESSDKDVNQSKPTSGSPGKELFYLKSTDNGIACADCHSDGTNNSNPLTKYFSNIQGANKRTSTYHGKFTGDEVAKNAGGATICWETYERMKTPLTEEQISALNEYYGSVAGDNSSTEIKYETIALPTRDKTKLKDVQKTILALTGDPLKGEAVFENACATCHSENSTVRKVPGIFEDFEGNVKSIIYNVRLGDGSMPFFHAPNLTDQELADIAAYIMKKNGK